jgi:hypothetical protein
VTLNSQYGTSQLVVVVFGPTIRPGFGTPIRKEGTEPAAPAAPDGDDRLQTNDDHSLSSGARTYGREDPDGIEFDERSADDTPSVECPFCGRRFAV